MNTLIDLVREFLVNTPMAGIVALAILPILLGNFVRIAIRKQ